MAKTKPQRNFLVFRCSEIPDTRYDTIMQNKANFKEAKMDVNICQKSDYEKNHVFGLEKNKANSGLSLRQAPQGQAQGKLRAGSEQRRMDPNKANLPAFGRKSEALNPKLVLSEVDGSETR